MGTGLIRRTIPVLLAALTLALLALSDRGEIAGANAESKPEQIVLTISDSPTVGPAIAASAGAPYLSPITQTERAFSHLMLYWEASVPVSATLTLEVRVSDDGLNWSDWGQIAADADLWMPEDGPEANWSQVLYAGDAAHFWQVRANSTASPEGEWPKLRRIEVNTVDGNTTLVIDQPVPQAAPSSSPAGINRPPVVSRTGWNCPDGQGSRKKSDYSPVTHMVVHHTADSNTLRAGESNWGARVRAIWQFHTFTREWGDIGYNYLVAPNGTIYEGRAGGDDAVGFHDASNYGSMGVAMIGTYSSANPSEAALSSLVELLAWKSSQKGLDPQARSWYFGCSRSAYCAPYVPGALVDTITGHRVVKHNPGTDCPGERVFAYLPAIRSRVAARLAGGDGGGSGGPDTVPPNGDLVIDELEQGGSYGFALSPSNWYSAECGYGGHTYYTFTTAGAAENSATWRPNLPSSGAYRVYVHIPQGCGLGPAPYASTQARYKIRYANGASAEVVVNQNTADDWVSLGVYNFNAGTDGTVELYDNTGEPYSTDSNNRKVLFFDTIKWVPESVNTAQAEIVAVSYEQSRLGQGELLKATFTVRNTGSVTIQGQPPQVIDGDTVGNGYVYDARECVWGNSMASVPAFVKNTGRFRVTLGIAGWDANDSTCNGADTTDFPWRWGLNSDLGPGQQTTVTGYVYFPEPTTTQVRAGLVQEYVKYHQDGVFATSVTTAAEQQAPLAASFNSQLQPLAHVYRLGSIPDNFLVRIDDPRALPRGSYIGSFAWNGRRINWGSAGPLGQSDLFMIDQTRVLQVNQSGNYTFRVTSDDGAWLWINGQLVVNNGGVHGESSTSGTIYLPEGTHSLAFRYFERGGDAVAAYEMQAPNASSFSPIVEGLGGGAIGSGNLFYGVPDLAIAADDLGGAGVNRIRWSLNGSGTIETYGTVARIGRLVPGNYTLTYTPIDENGLAGETLTISFRVQREVPSRTYVPQARR